MTKELDENILDDDYPVYAGYFYVADGKVVKSNMGFRDFAKTVKDLKAFHGYEEVRRCDAVARGIL